MRKKRENLTTYPLAGLRLRDLVSLFPAATSGQAIMYRGLAGWVADNVLMSDLGDVNLLGLVGGEMLVWDAGLGEWVVETPVRYIDDLADVESGGGLGWNNNELLRYNTASGEWVPIPAPTLSGQVLMNSAGTLQWVTVNLNFLWSVNFTILHTAGFDVGVGLPAYHTPGLSAVFTSP